MTVNIATPYGPTKRMSLVEFTMYRVMLMLRTYTLPSVTSTTVYVMLGRTYTVGVSVGRLTGFRVGVTVTTTVGLKVGLRVAGCLEGGKLGFTDGLVVGRVVGVTLGSSEGL